MQSRLRHSGNVSKTLGANNPFSWDAYWASRYISAFTLTVDSGTQITADWVNNGTADYDSIRIEIKPDGGSYTETILSIGTITKVFTGLTVGTLYYARIRYCKGSYYSDYITASATISTLFNNLVFGLQWDGTKWLNLVTGLAMVDPTTVAIGTAIFSNCDLPGIYVTASSKYLSTPDTPELSMGDIDFAVACFCKITDVTVAQNLCGQYLSTGDQRAWRLAVVSSVFNFLVSSNGTSGSTASISSGGIVNNTNYLVICWHNKTENTINIKVGNGIIYSKAWALGVKDSTADLTVGEVSGAGFAGGTIGGVYIWKKLLTETDNIDLFSGGLGNKYPFVSLSDYSLPYKIVLMGDKTAGEDITKSTTWNNIVTALNPAWIVGAGDYDGSVLTTTQLLANLTPLHFSAPGNHDDWAMTQRTEFNKNFLNNGGYCKLSLPLIDFFLYDPYLKMDESSNYGTIAEAEAITLAARQASKQGLWLINGLSASTAKWKVVIFHQPAWASSSDDEIAHGVIAMTAMRWDWASYEVDLILNGHFHFYERLLKDTGSGNIPIILLGTAGAADLGWINIDPDSIIRLNDAVDADFDLEGYLIEMTVTTDNLQIDLSAIDSGGVVHSGKDQLILT